MSTPSPATASLLDGLNEPQQQAAGFGVDDGVPAAGAPPLLVIAGAGSGKTTTLAARVARLVLAGADPNRLLLLTFSRRAALEMERRVGRALHDALGLAALQRAPKLPWCGTFHSVGARLLRSVADRVGLDPAFTVDDRADSEDL
ncbi:MAG: UvrD-helicase domain-containing protein, partial [Rhizobacter sp.]|nr:UvrD-helicase domain-containing protein [Rhizobacter sp.]